MSKLITIPVFDVDVLLFRDRDEAKAFFLTHTPNDDPRSIGSSHGVCITDDRYRMLCVFDGGIPIAAHESVHMAWAILKECGVRVSASNDEPLAYLTAWILNEVLIFLEETKEKPAD